MGKGGRGEGRGRARVDAKDMQTNIEDRRPRAWQSRITACPSASDVLRCRVPSIICMYIFEHICKKDKHTHRQRERERETHLDNQM